MRQIELSDFMPELQEKPKPLIESLSLTWCRTICPYCKMDNPDSEHNRKWVLGRRMYPYLGNDLSICPQCGKKYDRENRKIIMSKDYAECEKLGLKGAVRKNEKGQWEEVHV